MFIDDEEENDVDQTDAEHAIPTKHNEITTTETSATTRVIGSSTPSTSTHVTMLIETSTFSSTKTTPNSDCNNTQNVWKLLDLN